MVEMERIKISKWEYLSSRDIYYIETIEGFSRLVAGAFELPDGTLIGDSDTCIYIYQPK